MDISLLYRGHVREATKDLFQNPVSLPIHLVEAALVGTVLPDTADRVFRRILAGERLVGVAVDASLLADPAGQRGDATDRTAQRFDRRAAPSEVDRNIAAYTAQAVPAYLALLRHDTTSALRRLEALPDSLCPMCYFEQMTLGRLLAARKEDKKAAALLDQWLIDLTLPSAVLLALERGRVAERMGEREKAIQSYHYVADVWRQADPELQAYVTEAREGLRRLTSESGR